MSSAGTSQVLVIEVSSETYHSPEQFDVDELTSLLWGIPPDDRAEMKVEKCRWKDTERRHEYHLKQIPRRKRKLWLQ